MQDPFTVMPPSYTELTRSINIITLGLQTIHEYALKKELYFLTEASWQPAQNTS
jgi:hypothetical protein